MNKCLLAIACITLLEMVAIWRGLNGVALAAAIGAIAGLGGFGLGRSWKS